jgi:hypothetical protein
MSLSVCLCLIAGCTNEAPPPAPPSETTSAPAIDGTQFLLDEEPSDSANVIAVREAASDGDDIVITGRIGGSANPWINDRAAFSIVDPSLKACSDIPGDECDKPWDYCCETDKLPSATALVKFIDENGKPLAVDSRKLLSVKELQTVVVTGKAKRDEAGNLTVLASQLFVRPSEASQE